MRPKRTTKQGGVRFEERKSATDNRGGQLQERKRTEVDLWRTAVGEGVYIRTEMISQPGVGQRFGAWFIPMVSFVAPTRWQETPEILAISATASDRSEALTARFLLICSS